MNTKELKASIEKMESLLKEMRADFEKAEEKEYREAPHKTFKKGDWVRKGKEWGKVYWVENQGINCGENDGYMGIDLHSGSRGFRVCRRDDYEILQDADVRYLVSSHRMSFTGEEIQEMISALSRTCGNVLADSVRIRLKEIGNFEFNK